MTNVIDPSVELAVLDDVLGLSSISACMPPRSPVPKPGPCPGAKRGVAKVARVAKAAAGKKPAARRKLGALPPQPPIKALTREKYTDLPRKGTLVLPGNEFGWMQSDDVGLRARGFWYGRFEDQRNIRQVVRNIDAGRDPLEGVDRAASVYTEAAVYRSKDGPDGGPTFEPVVTVDDLDNDYVSAGRWLAGRLREQQPTTRPLYRGMLMRRDELPQAGDRFSTDIASWTDQKDWAQYYADLEADPDLGRVGDTRVVFKMIGPKHSVPFDEERFLGEHVARGDYEVVSVSGKGRRRTVTVREVQR